MIRGLLTVAVGGALIAVACIGLSGAGHRASWHVPGMGWSFDTDDDDRSPHLMGRDTIVTRDLPWQGGESLTFDVPAEIIYTQAAAVKITLSGPDVLVRHVVLAGDTVKFDRQVHDISTDHGLKIVITAPALHHFGLDAALKLDIHALRTDELSVAINGAGAVRAEGTARSARISIDGAGAADLDALAVTDANIQIDGIGHVTAGPTGTARVQIDGAGKVSLTKRPQHLDQQIEGIGGVSQPDAPPGQTL